MPDTVVGTKVRAVKRQTKFPSRANFSIRGHSVKITDIVSCAVSAKAGEMT